MKLTGLNPEAGLFLLYGGGENFLPMKLTGLIPEAFVGERHTLIMC